MKTVILSAAAFLLGVVVSPLMRTNASAMALPYQGSTVNSQRAIPQVPEVGLTDLTRVTSDRDHALQLDGMNCTSCVVGEGSILRYYGGAFQIVDLGAHGPVNLDLEGAAKNTFILLSALRMIGCPTKAPSDVKPNAPGIQTALLEKGTLISAKSAVGIAK
jgi:hypothetical protein